MRIALHLLKQAHSATVLFTYSVELAAVSHHSQEASSTLAALLLVQTESRGLCCRVAHLLIISKSLGKTRTNICAIPAAHKHTNDPLRRDLAGDTGIYYLLIETRDGVNYWDT